MNPFYERTVRYAGLSSVFTGGDVQSISLCSNQDALSGAQIRLRLKSKQQAVVLRDALVGVLYELRRGFRYRPSTEVSESAELAASFEAIGQDYNSQNACRDHIELLEFIQHLRDNEYDPEAFIQPDASVTITDEGILWEIFDKKASAGTSLFLKASSYEVLGDKTNGTIQVETSLALLFSLNRIQAEELEVHIGASPSLDEKYAGEHTKTERIPLWWLRANLQLQGFAVEESAMVTLGRMDAYNLMRFLRLHKKSADSDERRSLVFSLTPGQQPEVGVRPFGVRFTGTAEEGAYQGSRSIQLQTWETNGLWLFEPLFPVMSSFKALVMGTALPVMWHVDTESLSLSLYQMGFKANNWGKGIEIDQRVPRHGAVPAGFAEFKAGEASEDNRVLQYALQSDVLYFNPLTAQKIRRQQFVDLDLEALRFRDDSERNAYALSGSDNAARAQQLGIDPIDFDWSYTVLSNAQSTLKQFGLSGNFVQLSKAIDGAVDKMAEKCGVDEVMATRLISVCAQIVGAVCEAISVDRSKADQIVKAQNIKSWVETHGLHHATAEELKVVLYGVQSRIPAEQEMGMFEHIQNETGLEAALVKKALKVNLGLDLGDSSQFDAIKVQRAVKGLQAALNAVSSDPNAVDKALSGEPSGNKLLDELMSSSAVSLLVDVDHTGTLTFARSTVTEDGVAYTPTMTYHPDKGIRRPNCNCVAFKNNRQPCAHLKALWLHYCRAENARINATQKDPSLVTHQKATYVQSTKSEDILHHVEQNHRKLTLNSNNRKTTRLFSDLESARLAYAQQTARFESKNYLKAGE